MNCPECRAQMEKRYCPIPGISFLRLYSWDCGECGETIGGFWEREGESEESIRIGGADCDCFVGDLWDWRKWRTDHRGDLCAVCIDSRIAAHAYEEVAVAAP